jgi:hypothetical protein
MHPYDATDHHDLENGGGAFRRRFEDIVNDLGSITGRISGVVR